ncbi:hypothetical protein V2J09_013308 [Rumex salicifolius]
MEISSLTFTTPSLRPLSLLNGHRNLQFQALPPSIPSAIRTSNSTIAAASFNGGSRRLVRADAFKGQSLSANWDISASAPPVLPRFEDLDTTNMLLRQRIVFIGSQIDDMSADFVISQLLLLDAEDPTKDIKLFINSPGGSVTAGMGIYDAMKQCKADVSTVAVGLAASMGAFILAAGTKGKRFCMPNSRVMIHQPLGSAGGKATEMSIRVKEMIYHKIKINKIFSRITGKPESQIEMDTDRDYFMGPWEAKDYGLVDAVIDDGKPGLVAPLTDLSPPPKSKVWHYWKAEGTKKAKKNLASEHKFLQKTDT